VKRGLLQVLHNTTELPPFARNYKISLIKLVFFSSAVIPMVSTSQTLIPRVEVTRLKRKSLWPLCIFQM
jgi:hypothetical protein